MLKQSLQILTVYNKQTYFLKSHTPTLSPAAEYNMSPLWFNAMSFIMHSPGGICNALTVFVNDKDPLVDCPEELEQRRNSCEVSNSYKDLKLETIIKISRI